LLHGKPLNTLLNAQVVVINQGHSLSQTSHSTALDMDFLITRYTKEMLIFILQLLGLILVAVSYSFSDILAKPDWLSGLEIAFAISITTIGMTVPASGFWLWLALTSWLPRLAIKLLDVAFPNLFTSKARYNFLPSIVGVVIAVGILELIPYLNIPAMNHYCRTSFCAGLIPRASTLKDVKPLLYVAAFTFALANWAGNHMFSPKYDNLPQ
jgi:hypothetical protein